jgi:hypothetical protein
VPQTLDQNEGIDGGRLGPGADLTGGTGLTGVAYLFEEPGGGEVLGLGFLGVLDSVFLRLFGLMLLGLKLLDLLLSRGRGSMILRWRDDGLSLGSARSRRTYNRKVVSIELGNERASFCSCLSDGGCSLSNEFGLVGGTRQVVDLLKRDE